MNNLKLEVFDAQSVYTKPIDTLLIDGNILISFPLLKNLILDYKVVNTETRDLIKLDPAVEWQHYLLENKTKINFIDENTWKLKDNYGLIVQINVAYTEPNNLLSKSLNQTQITLNLNNTDYIFNLTDGVSDIKTIKDPSLNLIGASASLGLQSELDLGLYRLNLAIEKSEYV